MEKKCRNGAGRAPGCVKIQPNVDCIVTIRLAAIERLQNAIQRHTVFRFVIVFSKIVIKKRKSKQNLAPVFVNDDCLAQGFPEGDFNGKTVQGVRRDPEKHNGHATISVLEKHR